MYSFGHDTLSFWWLPFIWKYVLSFFLLLFFMLLSMGLFMLFGTDFFFFSCFLAWIFFFFFSIAHTFLLAYDKFRERDSWKMNGVFFCGPKSMFLRNSQCKSQHFICGCMWILIMGAWRESQHGSQQFDKAQYKYKQHILRFCIMEYCHMALVGLISFEEHANQVFYFIKKSQVLCKSEQVSFPSYYISYSNHLDKMGSLW